MADYQEVSFVHIGEIVKKILKDRRISNVEFAEMVDALPQTVYSNLKKDSWGVDIMRRYSEALGVNLFEYYTSHSPEAQVNEEAGSYGIAKQAAPAGIPYYDIDVAAGPGCTLMDTPEHPTKHITIPGFEDCDAALNVFGDSMYPDYCSGEVILVKEVKNKQLILPGEAYLIVSSEFRTIKYVHRGSTPGTVQLRSANPLYDPMDINLDDIIKIYLVKGRIKRTGI